MSIARQATSPPRASSHSPRSTSDTPERYDQSSLALVLYTDDLEGTEAKLRVAGVPFGAPDGPGCPTFQDPDGRWIQMVNPEDK